MIKKIFLMFLLLSSILNAQKVKDIIGKSDVIWYSPSNKSIESMLIGNGDIGVNLWVEKSGDLYIYIGKTDSWDEYSRLVKVGLVKIKISPSPFNDNFLQRLDLYNGQILITAGKPEDKLELKFWIDANNPVINIEYNSSKNFSYEVSPVLWRNKIREISGDERHSLYGFSGSEKTLYVYPDSILNKKNDKITWFHRNNSSIWKETLERQGMKEWAENHEDPLLNNTYGCVVEGSGLKSISNSLLLSEPEKEGRIRISVLTKKCNNLIEWISSINDISKTYEKKNFSEYYKNHLKYWNQFWNKSYIFLTGSEEAEKVSKAYTLQRFLFASAGRGNYPIKFNGSIFTADSCDKIQNYDADYRMWGGPYWNQNTRLIYWPMLVSGDLDLMKPYFDLYLNALPFAEAYSETLFHHNGAFYPETFYFWGSYTMDNFGWDTDIQNFKHIKNQYIRYHYQGALETLAMMFDYYSFTTDSKFVQEKILPFASEILTFYENRFPKDENGKMKIFPSQALETYWDISNPTPEIAGLRWNLSKLLSLPEKILSAKIKSKYEKLLSTIPEIPVSNEDGKKLILPCESVPDKVSNSETPELYPVFPYRFFGLNKPDLDRAVNTFYKAKFRGARCWQQTDVVAAYLGITDTAKNLLVHRLDYNHPKARFPIFWGSNMDWCPDEDHGGNLMIALQAMLLQYDEKSITLFPAFPKDWNVDFKLHAPDKTEISCIFEKGKLEKLDVIPKSAKNKIKIKK